jgi:RimJ/RimL family protein N-acetyltransferase
MAAVPIIETPRLRLRGHRLEDLDDCIAMWSDPAVVRFIGGTPSTPQQTWMRLLAYSGHWSLLGYGYWAIEERETGAFVGEVGFADFKRDIAQAMRGVPEIGWALASPFHGRGYGTQAVGAALSWGDENLPGSRTVCLIDPENAPSIRVAEKCGYRELDHAAYNGRPALFFSRPSVADQTIDRSTNDG